MLYELTRDGDTPLLAAMHSEAELPVLHADDLAAHREEPAVAERLERVEKIAQRRRRRAA